MSKTPLLYIYAAVFPETRATIDDVYYDQCVCCSHTLCYKQASNRNGVHKAMVNKAKTREDRAKLAQFKSVKQAKEFSSRLVRLPHHSYCRATWGLTSTTTSTFVQLTRTGGYKGDAADLATREQWLLQGQWVRDVNMPTKVPRRSLKRRIPSEQEAESPGQKAPAPSTTTKVCTTCTIA